MQKYAKFCWLFVFFSLISFATLSADVQENQALSRVNQLIKERQYDEALYSINEIIHSFPQNSRAYKLRGNLLFLTGHYQHALNDFERVADLLPNHHESYVDIAIVNYMLNNYDEALGYVDHALFLKPKSPFAFKVKMLILKEKESKKKS